MDPPIIFRSNVVLKSYANMFSSVLLQQHLSKEPIEVSFLGYIMTWFLNWILHVTPIAYSFEGTIYLLPSYSLYLRHMLVSTNTICINKGKTDRNKIL